MSGGGALGFSKSKSRSGSEQSTFVDPSQQPFLDFVRAQAQGLQGQQQGQIGSLFGTSQGLQQQGQEFLGGLQGTQQQLGQGFGGGFGQGQAGVDALTNFVGQPGQAEQALQQQAFGQNPALNQQIGQLGQDITRQFEQQLSGISLEAVGGGQLGGGRQGVAQGLLGQSALDAFSRGATDLRGQDIGRQLQAAQGLGGLEAQRGQLGGALGQLGGQQELGTAGLNQAGQLGAGQLGLGGLQSLQGQFNLGFSPFEAQFTPLQNLAQIIGGPTVLGSGSSFGRSDAFSASASGEGGFF